MKRTALALAFFCAAGSSAAEPRAFATFDLASEPVLNDPHDLAFGPDGRLYIADKFGGRIVVMDPETLEVDEVLETGPLPNVHDIHFGPDGRAVIAVTSANAAAVFDLSNLAAGPVEVVTLSRPEGAMLHSNGRVYATSGGTGEVLAVEGGEVVASAYGFFGAHDITEGPGGVVWVADNFNRRLVKLDANLKELQVLDDPSLGLVGARYLDVDDFGRLVVADEDANRVLLIDPDATGGPAVLGVIGDGTPGPGPGKISGPEGVAVDGSRYYFSDSNNNRIVRYSVVLN